MEQPAKTIDRMLTAKEVARLYGIHVKTVNRWTRDKSEKIPTAVYPFGSKREPRWFESAIIAHQERIRHECYTP